MSEEKRASLPFYSPRIWHGMTAGAWFPFLAKNQFAVTPTLIPLATGISLASLFNSGLRLSSELVYRKAATQVELEHPPLFVVGHWRTGTTLLHELLVRDERFSYPNTYQCMAPSHFLLTSRVLGPLIDLLMPRHRPMDNMAVGWRRPQEDEFALMNLGIGSNYRDWAFPNRPQDQDAFLTFKGLPEKSVEAWKEAFLWFIRRLAVYDSRRIVLKSPTHTGRIKTLLEILPDAKFLHITRDLRSVLPSTVRTWTRMTDALSLQKRSSEYSMEGRIAVFNRMYDQFFQDRESVPKEQLMEIRFEDLVSDPQKVLESVYDELDLGDFGPARPGIQAYLDETKDFQGNRHQLKAELEQKILSGCRRYMEEYSYV